MSTALARFLQRQLDARGMTADQFAKKHGLNSSGLYQLLRGERTYVQDRTLARLATALGMTLAEMVTAMSHTGSASDPDEAEWVALIRQVPSEKRPAAIDMLRGLAIQPVNKGPNPRGLQNGHSADSDKGRPGRGRTLKPHSASGDDSAEGGRLPSYHRSLKTQLVNAMAAFGRFVQPSNAFRAVPAR